MLLVDSVNDNKRLAVRDEQSQLFGIEKLTVPL